MRGISPPSKEGMPYIEDYFVRMQLSKIGVQFNGDNISSFEADYLSFIGACIKEEEGEMMKKASKVKGKKRG